MPPVTTAPAKGRGFWFDKLNSRLALLYNGTAFLRGTATGVTVPGTLAVTGASTLTGAVTSTGALTAAKLSTPAETGAGVTIATGVLTVTQTVVVPLPESGTTDTIDTITKAGVVAGDLLLLHVPATNTITVDDANINLAAATRAIAPGGSLLLVYDGTQWSEVAFTAASDNV